MADGGFEETGGRSRALMGAIDAARLFARCARASDGSSFRPSIAFGGALAFVTLVSPRYTGVAKVLLENQESYFTRPDKAVSDPGQQIDDQTVQSQAELAASPDMARKVMEKLGLAARSEFNASGIVFHFHGAAGRRRRGRSFRSRRRGGAETLDRVSRSRNRACCRSSSPAPIPRSRRRAPTRLPICS